MPPSLLPQMAGDKATLIKHQRDQRAVMEHRETRKKILKAPDLCFIYTTLSLRQSKRDLEGCKIMLELRYCTTGVKDRQKIKCESVPFTSEPTKLQTPWLTPTSPFFQLIPWNHSKIQRFDTVPSESGLPRDVYSYFIQLCRVPFYNFGTENNVCSDKAWSLLCFQKDVCPDCRKAKLSSSKLLLQDRLITKIDLLIFGT